ncbi:MAG: carboxypeptidase regulatory-like domain-containing protein [Proteobacteria bacterium]|nr:carboxypeptidase regulatory-like domain-containing protein [Pseudomonadota bacterium]
MSRRAPVTSFLQAVLGSLLGICAISLAGCGGGTSGTGLQTFDGQVKSADGDPVAGATVTLTATGEAAVTDESGRFVLRSAVESDPQQQLEFLLESTDFNGTFSVPESALSEGSAQISVDIVIDPVTRTLELTNFSLQVRMVGFCSAAFSNGDTVRQLRELPPGTRCTLQTEVRGDGIPRENVPFALQVRTCSGRRGAWQTVAVTSTGEGETRGSALMEFAFISTAKLCRYRVVAPFNDPNYRPAVFAIETLREQAAKEEIAADQTAASSDKGAVQD